MNLSPVLRSAAFVLVAALAWASPPPARAAGGDIASILSASGAAMRLDAIANVHTLHLRGTIEVAGIPGTADAWVDLRDGRYAQYVQAGAIGGDAGYDATHAWNRDLSGVVWDDGSIPARAAALDQAYMNRYLLWTPGYGGASVTSTGQKVIGGTRYDVLTVTPPGSRPFEVWIGTVSHLLARTVIVLGPSTTVTTFGDYRAVRGLRVPFRQRTDADGNLSTFQAARADVDDDGAQTALQRPQQHVTDVTLPSAVTSIPFELVDNHVALDVMLDGKGPFHFIFDTGGQNIVDADVARQLGLTATGSASGGGVGSANETVRFATIDTVGVGGATLRKQVFAVAPVHAGFGVGSGKPIDGLIGFEVLARFTTTFDYAANRVVLRLPAPAAAAASGTTIPFVFNGQHPMVDCTIAGIASTCVLDTGSRLALSVLTPFGAAHPSVVPADVTAAGANGYGVGGASMGRLGRSTLQLAGFTIPDIVTDFSTQTRGAFADPFYGGNVGAGVLKRFAVTFDYARLTVTFVPNTGFAARETYDRSGLFLISQRGAIVVADVRPGTPAAQAGLLRGETVVSVGGKDAAALGLAAIRAAFQGPAGAPLVLRVSGKDGAVRPVTLTLRDYV